MSAPDAMSTNIVINAMDFFRLSAILLVAAAAASVASSSGIAITASTLHASSSFKRTAGLLMLGDEDVPADEAGATGDSVSMTYCMVGR